MLRVLFSAPYMIPCLDRFRPVFDAAGIELIVARVEERLSEAGLMGHAGQVDGVICGDDCFSRTVLEAYAPRLKVISKWGTGIDSIDREAAAGLGVKVCNTPGAFTEAVADSVLGYILTFARRTPWMDRSMKAGRWEKILGRALHECTLGVVGVGAIGKAVLRRAQAFGMTLLGNDIVAIAPEFIAEVGVEMTSFTDLLGRSDFVSVNCDLNPTSRHLIDGVALRAMRPTAVLINTARGPIIDQPALVEALQAGRIAGAALDVYEGEPLPPDSPPLKMDNVLLAPHNANSSLAAWERVHWNTIRNLFLGRATVEVFHAAGWDTVAVDRQSFSGCPEGVDVRQADVSLPDSVAELFAWLRADVGRLDALVNNAAIQICKPLVETTPEEWDAVMASNLRSIFLTVRAGYPLLKAAAGAVVNVSSVHAVATSVDIAAYAASKGGSLALTRAMALEFARDGVRVNVILPGAVERHYSSLVRDEVTGILPLLVDLVNPSPALGWAGAERDSLLARGPADLVMALALVHHLAISNNVPLVLLADFLAGLAPRLIIEFVPKTDLQVELMLSTRRDIFDQYTQKGFEMAFQTRFSIRESAGIRETTRRLYFMERLGLIA